MRGFYNVIDKIRENLEASEFVNTMTYGDIHQVDLAKKTMFPLSHYMVDGFTYGENIITYDISFLCMDIINISKDEVTDVFHGNSNEQDILNTQHQVLIDLFDSLKTGDLYVEGYQLIGDPSPEPFIDRFDNVLAGWAVSFQISVINDNTCP